MLSNRMIMISTKGCWDKIMLSESFCGRQMQFLSGQEQAYPLRQASLIQGRDLKIISRTLFENVVLGICIPGDFILLKVWRNTGHIGQDMSLSIVTGTGKRNLQQIVSTGKK